jgi:hypothetical protein
MCQSAALLLEGRDHSTPQLSNQEEQIHPQTTQTVHKAKIYPLTNPPPPDLLCKRPPSLRSRRPGAEPRMADVGLHPRPAVKV